jgi:bacterioferritin
MKAKKGVLEFLNKILTAELTAVHQNLGHAAMCENWGYPRLHHKLHEQASEAVSHAEGIIAHILYLEGTPDMERVGTVTLGQTVPDQLKYDLKREMDDLQLLREAIAHCGTVGDYTTRHKLEALSVDTDEHIDWLERQQETIKQIGLENYLSQQMK